MATTSPKRRQRPAIVVEFVEPVTTTSQEVAQLKQQVATLEYRAQIMDARLEVLEARLAMPPGTKVH